MQGRYAGQHAEQVLGGAAAQFEHGMPGGERDVRGEDHVRPRQQRGRDLGLGREDSLGRAAGVTSASPPRDTLRATGTRRGSGSSRSGGMYAI